MLKFQPRSIRQIILDQSALAMIEMAFALPLILLLGMTGAEYVNYITAKMRVSQLALQIADNAARMGEGTTAGPKTISEADINDVFTGAQLQSGTMNVQANAKIILSDLEIDTVNTTASSTKYKIMWQRCYGSQIHPSNFGIAPKEAKNPNSITASNYQNLTGIGPSGQQVTAQASNPVMFVEVYYVYRPLFLSKFSLIPTATFDEIASMAVRDQRDLTLPPKNAENVTPSWCP
jgi:Flp pilus assembly protein TadG